MRYVTYYYSIMGGLSDVKFHDKKDDAVKFYRKAAHGYTDNKRHQEWRCMVNNLIQGRRNEMGVIKFSHDYPKLHGQTSAELLAVRSIRIDKNTPQELLEYDTKYDGGYYKLATGDYIQLIFLGNLSIPFCTIRRNYPPQKGDYYRGKVGDVFTIEVKPETKGETK